MNADLWTWLGSATGFAFAMSATPGPNNAMLVASGATWGLRRTVPHLLGVSIGFPAMLLAVGLGAGAIFRANHWLQDGLRWCGAAYMLWLAAKIARAEPVPPKLASPGASRAPLSFVQASLFQWINPKAWVTAVGAIVTYTVAGNDPLTQALVLMSIFLAVSLPVTVFWTAVGVGAARLLRSRRALRLFNWTMAALLAASLMPMLLGE